MIKIQNKYIKEGKQLTHNTKYPLKITTSMYEIILSGVIHIKEQEVKFEFANLEIVYKFVTDSKGSRFESEVIEKKLVISLYNFSNSLGEGRVDPVEIGTLDNRKLLATFYVDTHKDNVRQFNYSFMLEN